MVLKAYKFLNFFLRHWCKTFDICGFVQNINFLKYDLRSLKSQLTVDAQIILNNFTVIYYLKKIYLIFMICCILFHDHVLMNLIMRRQLIAFKCTYFVYSHTIICNTLFSSMTITLCLWEQQKTKLCFGNTSYYSCLMFLEIIK